MIRSSKRKYYQDTLKESRGNMRKVWKVIKELSGTDIKTMDCPKLEIAGELITDVDRVVSLFNQYFVDTADRVLGDTITGTYVPSTELLHHIKIRNPQKVLFNIPFITCDNVVFYFRKLGIRKATGVDELSVQLLRSLENAIVEPFVQIINTSIRTSCFPDQWKLARVLPLHKSGSKTCIDNYRPVSILCVLSKVLEKHIYKHFYRFLTKYDMLSEYQSGFRGRHSCETCICKLTDSWYTSLDQGQIIGCVALDLSRAFDLVPHDVLLKKLAIYCCNDSTVNWFRSYLINRRQCVHIKGNNASNFKFIKCGVPQGSILGPLLFNIYINDLPLCLSVSEMEMYADDTTLFFANKDLNCVEHTLQNDLNNISSWCANNNLVINPQKTKCMLICSSLKRRNLHSASLNLQLDSCKIEHVKSFKMLGMHVDETLSWSVHVNMLCSSLTRVIGAFWRIHTFLDYRAKMLYYNSYILPKLTYCISVWGPNVATSLINKLYIIQKRAVRIIFNTGIDTPSQFLFLNARLLNINQLVFYNQAVFIFKILNNLSAPCLSSMLESNTCSSSRQLRSSVKSNLLKVPHAFHNCCFKAFRCSGPRVWNALPNNVRDCNNFNTFKRLCKRHIFSQM